MKKTSVILILFIVISIGCLQGDARKSESGALVDASWMSNNLENSGLKIIAATAIKDQYDAGHVAGSLHIDYKTDIVDLENPVPNQMAPKEKVQGLLRRLGIKNTDTVLVYDNTNNMIAARVYNVLKFYGHKDVRLLNGGQNSWIASGGELVTPVPNISPSGYAAVEKDSSDYVALEYVYNNLKNPDIIILDVRPTPQYTGEDVRPGIGRGGGHIPGALNVPGGLTWNEDGTIKGVDELRPIYESAGVDRDKRIIVYCHNGMLASYSWFVLSQVLGYPDVALFDGSSLEWTNHPDTPLVKGPEPGAPPADLKPF